MTNEYYKKDLCNSESSCKLYNPLVTQGQCEYYNEWCEFKKELEVYKKALRLAVLTQCNKSRQDLINQICKFNFTAEVYEFFIDQARKELEESK